jgi:transcriptional regulator with XRE-family HTH domain
VNRLLRFLGPALRLMRQRRRMRQVDLAGRARITKQMLSTYERRRRFPSLRTLSKILDALYANVSDLGAARWTISSGRRSGGSSPRSTGRGGACRPGRWLLLIPALVITLSNCSRGESLAHCWHLSLHLRSADLHDQTELSFDALWPRTMRTATASPAPQLKTPPSWLTY